MSNVDVTIDLYQDWVDTVKTLFQNAGQTLPADLTDDEITMRYFLQNGGSEEAAAKKEQLEKRLAEIQQTIVDNLDSVIIPDIRKRTKYEGNRFVFKWVYYEGEHIIEECSEYRIPL